ncbi:hypothetical protein, partial [Blastomonas sp. CCH13-E1]|uniref:hypothetical protein n=1 Tax=Blastomonas sp. CCH13-E1 TaxID=1768739 RepID=UPI001E44D9B0
TMQPGDHTPNYTSLTDVTINAEPEVRNQFHRSCGRPQSGPAPQSSIKTNKWGMIRMHREFRKLAEDFSAKAT